MIEIIAREDISKKSLEEIIKRINTILKTKWLTKLELDPSCLTYTYVLPSSLTDSPDKKLINPGVKVKMNPSRR